MIIITVLEVVFLPALHLALTHSHSLRSHIGHFWHPSRSLRTSDSKNSNSDNFICNLLGISNKVNKSYLSVTNRFQSLALSNKWINEDGSIWPISLSHLLAYIAVVHKSVSPPTLLSYLSALNDKHSSMGLNWNSVRYNPSTLRTLSLIKRSYVHKPTKKAEIITRSHLLKISTHEFPDKFETLLFRAIAFIAFYGLARLGELVQSSSAPSHNTLYVKNIAIHSDANPPCMLIQLPLSKTRNSAFPDILVMHQTYDELCPTRIISTYIKARLSLNLTADQQYLFSRSDGSLTNKRWFLQNWMRYSHRNTSWTTGSALEAPLNWFCADYLHT